MKKAIMVIFLIGVLGFIFYMSAQNAVKSYSYNIEVLRLLKAMLGIDLYSLLGNEYVDVIIRKLGHLFEFSLLSVAACLVFSNFKIKRVMLSTTAFCIFLGFVDEFHQLYVQGRESSMIDVIIDSFGVLMTMGIISLIRIIKYEILNTENNYNLKKDKSLP